MIIYFTLIDEQGTYVLDKISLTPDIIDYEFQGLNMDLDSINGIFYTDLSPHCYFDVYEDDVYYLLEYLYTGECLYELNPNYKEDEILYEQETGNKLDDTVCRYCKYVEGKLKQVTYQDWMDNIIFNKNYD